MKKSDFVAELAKKADISQAKASDYLNAMLEIISDTLKAGDKVTLTGFGTFEVRDRAARTVTDIRTKEKRQTPASKHPAFSAGSVLKASIHPAHESAVKSKPVDVKTASAKTTSAKAVAKAAPVKASKSSKQKASAK